MPFKDPAEKKSYDREYQLSRTSTHKCVKLTMTMSEYKKFQTYADNSDLTVARAIFQLANNQIDSIQTLSPETKDQLRIVTRELNAWGNNINQIAAATNLRLACTDDPPTPEEGVQLLSEIRDGIVRIEIYIQNQMP